VKTMRAFSSQPADALVEFLRIQGLTFSGPFYTPAKHAVFVIEDYIFLESELIDLYRQNQLNPQGIRERAHRIMLDSL
jgi:hypothetical protein